MNDERLIELLQDSTLYCCYCGDVQTSYQCCSENHFQTFADMTIGEQQDFLDQEVL